MEHTIIQSLFYVLMLALLGGSIAWLLKLPALIGYIVAGIVGVIILPEEIQNIQGLSEIGIVLLLFSIGLELSFSKLTHVGYVALLGSILQMIVSTVVFYFVLRIFSLESIEAFILAAGFSLSSTAIVVKMLDERGETEAIHGDIMIGWLLTQDLAVIPIMALLPILAAGNVNFGVAAISSLLVSLSAVIMVIIIGKKLSPFITKAITMSSARELLLLGSVAIALGTAYLVSLFGISPALGAFLAGVVISETQERHAIFSETRPLRDLFVILFFVTLGFFVNPVVFAGKFGIILLLSLFVLVTKGLLVGLILKIFGYKGKTVWATAVGLTQIGEFSFIIFLSAQRLNIVSSEIASIGAATTLITLLLTPFMFRSVIPLWYRLRGSKMPHLTGGKSALDIENHIIICGFGRMGRWIGRALDSMNVKYVVIDYNQQVIKKAKEKGIQVVYGDPVEPSVLEAAQIRTAKAIVVAIPDTMTQEEVISYCQNVAPDIPIFARAHLDEDLTKLSQFGVQRVIQPEFEAALSVVKEILKKSGKSKQQITERMGALRRLHTTIK